jgi:hypothetical protein
MAKIFFVSVVCLASLCGCTQWQGLIALKHYSDSQRVIARDMRRNDVLFGLLFVDAQNNEIHLGMTRKQIINRYGEPILTLPANESGAVEKSLYRKAYEYIGADKVYLYFDCLERIVKVEVCQKAKDVH